MYWGEMTFSLWLADYVCHTLQCATLLVRSNHQIVFYSGWVVLPTFYIPKLLCGDVIKISEMMYLSSDGSFFCKMLVQCKIIYNYRTVISHNKHWNNTTKQYGHTFTLHGLKLERRILIVTHDSDRLPLRLSRLSAMLDVPFPLERQDTLSLLACIN